MSNSLIQEPQEELLNAIRNGQQAVVEVVKTWVDTIKSATPKVPSLQLPLKVLIWADGSRTNVTYYSPAALAARYDLSAELAANLAGIDPLTDALVAQ
jgi:hypothetical protein